VTDFSMGDRSAMDRSPPRAAAITARLTAERPFRRHWLERSKTWCRRAWWAAQSGMRSSISSKPSRMCLRWCRCPVRRDHCRTRRRLVDVHPVVVPLPPLVLPRGEVHVRGMHGLRVIRPRDKRLPGLGIRTLNHSLQFGPGGLQVVAVARSIHAIIDRMIGLADLRSRSAVRTAASGGGVAP